MTNETHAEPEPDSPKSDDTKNDANKASVNADIAQLGYEDARDELANIVSTLESGRAPLEESMKLWERGEALAEHCQKWLDGAQKRIEDAVAARSNREQ